ncbi:MAG: 50S ribosomal protein bL37 [Planctomycetota bacterium]
MAKPHRVIKKANHGKRPANSKAKRLKRKNIRTP